VRKGRNQRWRLRYALFHIYFRLQASIFDLSPIRTSGILWSTSVVLPDHENMGIAVGISLLLRTQPKIQVLYMFMAAILIFDMDFCHLLSFYRRQPCRLEKHNTDHCIAHHWSFTLVDTMMSFSFSNLYVGLTSNFKTSSNS